MSWFKNLWKRPKADDNSEEARKYLNELEQRDAEVQQLGQELREMQSRNNFSGMVHDAITRTSPKGPRGEPAS